MKKLLILVFALVMVLSLVACGDKTDSATSGGGTSNQSSGTEEDAVNKTVTRF